MNEEMWLPQIDPDLCTGCGDCVVACPTQALAMEGDLAVVANPQACNYSAYCEAVCPVDAIALPYQIVWGDDSTEA
ncbi:MAG: ATP-binding protein [Chloroflexota bacterium]